MAKLAGHRSIRRAKIVGYLLNPASTTGGAGKAKFFMSFGFSSKSAIQFTNALDTHAAEREVESVEQTEHGIKSVLRCSLQTPDGRNPCIVAVWIQDSKTDEQKFVTAYPNT